jgi:uroporphyrin-3 C-methyltransferase
VEQLLTIASQQLQLAGNIKPALLALQTAVTRLQQIDTPQANALRNTIARDIQHLQNLPQANIAGIDAALESLSTEIETLPLVSDRRPTSTKTPQSAEKNFLHELFSEMWRDIKQMVRLERIDRPEPPLLSPDQTFFLRENLKLRLLVARIALLQHDGAVYRTNLQAARQWIKQHFDTSNAQTRQVLNTLDRLSTSAIELQPPALESLHEAGNYKLSFEKPAGALDTGGRQ